MVENDLPTILHFHDLVLLFLHSKNYRRFEPVDVSHLFQHFEFGVTDRGFNTAMYAREFRQNQRRVVDIVAAQLEMDLVTRASLDTYAEYEDNTTNVLEFHLKNPSWVRFAIKTGQHPRLDKSQHKIDVWVKDQKHHLCPEPLCVDKTHCNLNLETYQKFCEVIKSATPSGKPGLFFADVQDFEGTWVEHARTYNFGEGFSSHTLQALLADGFTYSVIAEILMMYGMPVLLKSAKSGDDTWDTSGHHFKFITAGYVEAPKFVVGFHSIVPGDPTDIDEWVDSRGISEEPWEKLIQARLAVEQMFQGEITEAIRRYTAVIAQNKIQSETDSYGNFSPFPDEDY